MLKTVNDQVGTLILSTLALSLLLHMGRERGEQEEYKRNVEKQMLDLRVKLEDQRQNAQLVAKQNIQDLEKTVEAALSPAQDGQARQPDLNKIKEAFQLCYTRTDQELHGEALARPPPPPLSTGTDSTSASSSPPRVKLM